MTISATTQGLKPGVCTSTARPANPFDGQVIYMTDVDQTAVWDGTQWVGLDPSRDRNVVINGAMQVAQRGTSTASITAADTLVVDRFATNISALGTWTMSQESDAPTGSGFRQSLKMLVTTADASPAAADFAAVKHNLEGQNIQQFLKGTASAKTFSLSMWVKSGTTGTYIAELVDVDNTRFCSQSYTISVADTWEKKTLVFPADTTGVLDNDNAHSLSINFYLAAGSTRNSGTLQTVWGTSSTTNRATGQVNLAAAAVALTNYWQITGVQLEAGSVATPFEFENIGTTLAKCQRYFEKSYNIGTTPGTAATIEESIGLGVYTNTPAAYNRIGSGVFFKVPKRATPTIVQYAPYSGSTAAASNATSGDGSTAVGYVSAQQPNQNGFNIAASIGGSTSTGYFTIFYAYTASAEL